MSDQKLGDEAMQRSDVENTHGPCTHVLRSPKLITAILINLPMKDLLFAQAVFKTWKHTIEVSEELQKALFFQSVTPEVAFFNTCTAFSETGMPVKFPNSLGTGDFFYRVPADSTSLELVERQNEVRMLLTRPCSSERRLRWAKENEAHRDDLRAIATRTPVLLNRLLLSHFYWFHDFFHAINRAPERFYKLDLEGNADLKPSARRPEASWRRMLISQPPLVVISALVDGNSAWNILGEKDWGRPITMDYLRTKMAVASGYSLKLYGTKQMGVWKDGSDLKKITMHSKALKYEVGIESDTESDSDGEKEDSRTKQLRERIAKMMRDGGPAGDAGGRRGRKSSRRPLRMREFASGRGMVIS